MTTHGQGATSDDGRRSPGGDGDRLRVTGGAGGVAVEVAAVAALGRAVAACADRLLEVDVRLHRAVLDPDLLASAPLDPSGVVRVQARLVAATAGPAGLTAVLTELALQAARLRLAVLRYDAAERAALAATDARRFAVGAALPLVAGPVLLAAGGVTGYAALTGRSPVDVLGATAARHPGLAEEAIGAVPGLLSAGSVGVAAVLPAGVGPLLTPTLSAVARHASRVYPVTGVTVRPRGRDRAAEAAGPARGVGDLVGALVARDATSRGGRQGEIAVRVLTSRGPDGRDRRSYVVDIPGTRDWQLAPTGARPGVNDLRTNLLAFSGGSDPRSLGVLRALAAAGARRGEPVLLVGHSQGGLVALRVAQQVEGSRRFTVTHVLTTGTPAGHVRPPPSVHVLAVENTADLVPRLDGRPNRDEPGRTTVTVDRRTGTVGGNHSLAEVYLPAARRLDGPEHRDHVSVRAWREGAAPFLAGRGEVVSVREEIYDLRGRRDMPRPVAPR